MRLILPFLLTGGVVVYTLISCSFGSDDPSYSSSSATKVPNSSSSKISISSSSSIDCSAISSSSAINEDLCSDFDPDTEVEHYDKMKKQFCDKRDGKKYVYVQIGEQIWMAENLNFAVCGSKCGGADDFLKDTNTDNCDKFGRLYDWFTALSVCPNGWHLPSDAEWTALTDYAGDSAGIKLRAISKDWICIESTVLKRVNYLMDCICCDSYEEGTDDYGFSALPGGDGYNRYFYGAGFEGSWWSSTEYHQIYAHRWYIEDFLNDVHMSGTRKIDFNSVRCVKD